MRILRTGYLLALMALVLMVIILVCLVGCNDNKVTQPKVYNTISLQPVNFQTLKSGLIYEGWVVNMDEDSNWVEYESFGKFFWDLEQYRFLSPRDTLRDIDTSFTINGNAFDYQLIAITLEEHPIDLSPEPSPTIVAQSAIDPEFATIMRFPAQVDIAKGHFAIGTFSDGYYDSVGDPIENEFAGLWFIEYAAPLVDGELVESWKAGLTLPVLPDTGYIYEGWVALNGGDTLSTGKFFLPDFFDADNSHCLDGFIPNYPGEDFMRNALPGVEFPLDITNGGGHALVTIEPRPDNDLLRPSNLLVLRGNLPTDATNVRAGSYSMENVAATRFPRINVYFTAE